MNLDSARATLLLLSARRAMSQLAAALPTGRRTISVARPGLVDQTRSVNDRLGSVWLAPTGRAASQKPKLFGVMSCEFEPLLPSLGLKRGTDGAPHGALRTEILGSPAGPLGVQTAERKIGAPGTRADDGAQRSGGGALGKVPAIGAFRGSIEASSGLRAVPRPNV
jgi:hypothetical protein